MAVDAVHEEEGIVSEANSDWCCVTHPPRVRVMSLIILCSAIPRSTTELGVSRDMASYMSLSISQKAIVLSPTNAYTDHTDMLSDLTL